MIRGNVPNSQSSIVNHQSARGAAVKGPLVSVLLPTYNRRRYLPEALASALRQTYGNLEVFVIRDGGEEVADVVRSFRDSRVILIDRKDNRGKPYSLNEALARATGTYVAYLDDDDVYYRHHVATLIEALETQTDCQVAYSDLYKVYCRTSPEGERVVLSKHVEISRDFDRFMMLYFNHVLHVSLMHRRDLLDKTGPYNEDLNVLIDWDMTRRLAFFSDFHHLLTVTGEFYSPVGESDRISVQRRKDQREYARNVLTIRTTHPPKPWPKIGELSIILLIDRLDQDVGKAVIRLWQRTFYPYRLYIPLPPADLARLRIEMPNVVPVPVEPLSSADERVDVALQQAQGRYVAVAPSGWPFEDLWVENALHALIRNPQSGEGFLLDGVGDGENTGGQSSVGSTGQRGLVVRRTDLLRARNVHPHLSVEASLTACGLRVRRPKPEELPFQFDNWLQEARLAEADGDWATAARMFESLADRYQNRIWLETMAARAHFEAGHHEEAAKRSGRVNRVRPTVDTLLLEAKAHRRRRDFAGAIWLLSQAEQWLCGEDLNHYGYDEGKRDREAQTDPALRAAAGTG